jgi:uncharacterized protein YjbI with pentapeptide repeats
MQEDETQSSHGEPQLNQGPRRFEHLEEAKIKAEISKCRTETEVLKHQLSPSAKRGECFKVIGGSAGVIIAITAFATLAVQTCQWSAERDKARKERVDAVLAESIFRLSDGSPMVRMNAVLSVEAFLHKREDEDGLLAARALMALAGQLVVEDTETVRATIEDTFVRLEPKKHSTETLDRAAEVIRRSSRIEGLIPLFRAGAKLRDMSGAVCKRPCDFSGLNLTGVVFDRATLAYADFSDCILAGTSFKKATLTGANFSGLDLSGVPFDEAGLQDAFFRGCTLTGASFERAFLEGADFSGAKCQDVASKSSRLDGAGADFCGANLLRVRFDSAFLRGSSLRFDTYQVRGDRVKQLGCLLDSLNCPELVLATFDGTDLAGVDFTGMPIFPVITRSLLDWNKEEFTKVTPPSFIGANLKDANFSKPGVLGLGYVPNAV